MPRLFVIVALTRSPRPTENVSNGSDGVVDDRHLDRLRLLARRKGERAVPCDVVPGLPSRAVGRAEADGDGAERGAGELDVNFAPPLSLATGSLIESDGGAFLSMIVPCPCGSPIRAPAARNELDDHRLVLLVDVSPSTGTRSLLGMFDRLEGQSRSLAV